LFDDGYITVANDYHVEVSRRLYADYGNGKDYYKYHGQNLVVLPEQSREMPDNKFLEWHNENIYLG
jgi:putative restriction endonuclease